jgi:hypothetical protein
MTDTPETDAFFWRKDIDWDKEVEFCRKLERERNEWKEVAEGSLLGAIHERDEAGELAANLEISLTAAIRSANVRQDELTAVTEQRDRLAEALLSTLSSWITSPNSEQAAQALAAAKGWKP